MSKTLEDLRLAESGEAAPTLCDRRTATPLPRLCAVDAAHTMGLVFPLDKLTCPWSTRPPRPLSAAGRRKSASS